MASQTRLALAPMSLSLRIMTVCLMGLPVLFSALAFQAPWPVAAVMGSAAVFIILIYASVWLFFRPTHFELDDAGLRIVWPLRQRFIPRHAILDARRISAEDFRREYGWGMRIGAGGLWGGFGLLKTSRETFSMWISRTDELMIVRLRSGRPLLITPVEPQQLVAALSPSES